MIIKLSKKYKLLFELLKGKHPEVDTVIMYGGRYSSKSFTLMIFCAYAALFNGFKILLSRFTNVSISDSVKAEFEKVVNKDHLNYSRHFSIIKDRAKSKFKGSNEDYGEVVFKGIKTGSRGQTANLKSLSGFNIWAVDEAEEIPDLETFDKVDLSIRSERDRNITILVLNPSSSSHWIYQRFFENKVDDLFSGIHDNVLYIYTSYKDIPFSIIPKKIINKINYFKENAKEYYKYNILGYWNKNSESKVVSIDSLNYITDVEDQYCIAKVCFTDVADKGNDYLACHFAKIYEIPSFEGGQSMRCIDVFDTYYTKDGMDKTVPELCRRIKKYKIDYTGIESNNMGIEFFKAVQANCEGYDIYPIHSSTNKHTRIIMEEVFIKSFIRILKPEKRSNEYIESLNEIGKYNRDDGMNKDLKNDDSIDALSNLCKFIKRRFDVTF